MKIKEKNFLYSLHEVRKNNKREREERKISGKEWLKQSKKNAEKLLGYSIPVVKSETMQFVVRDKPRKA
jgi:hypothetical protein